MASKNPAHAKKPLETHLIRDWDSVKNFPVTANDISRNNKEAFWWTCPSGHSYQVSVFTRLRTNGCKICNKDGLLKKNYESHLQSGRFSRFSEKASPELLSQWDYELNTVKPNEISYKSKTKVFWKCIEGHSWSTSPAERVRGSKCPKCDKKLIGDRVRNAKFKSGVLSLAEEYPDLLLEWDYEKNSKSPEKFTSKSGFRANWKCKYGHEWLTSIYNSTENKSNCPKCSSQTSRLEIFTLCELRSIFSEVEWRMKIDGVEADIYIPKYQFAFEIDGEYWHRNKLDSDIVKYHYFKSKGIKLFRIRAELLPEIEGDVITFTRKQSDFEIFKNLIVLLRKYIEVTALDSYLEKSEPQNTEVFKAMLARLPAPPEDESRQSLYPDISKEWDFQRNIPLTPDLFSAGSEQRFWWTCGKHHWETSIKNRTAKNSGCPECYRESHADEMTKWFAVSHGSFLEKYPKLAEQWDRDKNSGLLPENVSHKSDKNIYWLCNKGHSFERGINAFKKDHNCPICNSFGQLRPELSEEWDYERNLGLNPNGVSLASSKSVWWICSKGHSYKADISARSSRNEGCPICWGIKRGGIEEIVLARRENKTLQQFRPELISFWNLKKNSSELNPGNLSIKDKTKYWWQCPSRHEYEQSPFKMVNGFTCPKCGSLNAPETTRILKLQKSGSLAQNYPALMSKWHPTKNEAISPQDISSGSKIKAWWYCEYGHEFQKTPNDVTTLIKRGSKFFCPKCKLFKSK